MAGKRKGNDDDNGGSGKKAKKVLIDEGNSVSGCCNEFGLDVHKFSLPCNFLLCVLVVLCLDST